VVLGTPTYGKGSAQNVFPVPGGGALKLTTALWFTPSGRSINRTRIAMDDGTPADTTKPRPKYKTDAGRTVLGGGGITPDVVLPTAPIAVADTAFGRALGKQIPKFSDALTDYALSLKGAGTVRSPDFAVTPEMRAELWRRMQSRGITVDTAMFQRASALIDRMIGYEVTRYVFGIEAEYARRLRDDDAVKRTVRLLDGVGTQKELLERVSSQGK
jgi:carboxyl-terminal processing protease